ncbi:MAG: P1 family peptidase, partial [Vicinamibacterales bacterium]
MSDQATPWFRVGHVTHHAARTGCTVILFDELVPAAVDIRGGAPGTRETALLGEGRLVGRADAILLTGGSAFGLAAADGVMRYLVEWERGFPTSALPVPIVPAAVIYDLANGDAIWPTADDGYNAALNATGLTSGLDRWLGAGAGATVAKLDGDPKPGGIGVSTIHAGEVTVTAIVVLNAVGDIVDPAIGQYLARAGDDGSPSGRELAIAKRAMGQPGENTTIGAVLIDGPMSREALHRCCIAAHGALARCVIPAQTIYDGDTFFAASRSAGGPDPDQILGVAAATEVAVERAIVGMFRNSS